MDPLGQMTLAHARLAGDEQAAARRRHPSGQFRGHRRHRPPILSCRLHQEKESPSLLQSGVGLSLFSAFSPNRNASQGPIQLHQCTGGRRPIARFFCPIHGDLSGRPPDLVPRQDPPGRALGSPQPHGGSLKPHMRPHSGRPRPPPAPGRGAGTSSPPSARGGSGRAGRRRNSSHGDPSTDSSPSAARSCSAFIALRRSLRAAR